MNWIPFAISLGAVFGALSRYYITLFWIERRGQRFPYGTIFFNLTGAFLIGLVSMLLIKQDFPVGVEKMILVRYISQIELKA